MLPSTPGFAVEERGIILLPKAEADLEELVETSSAANYGYSWDRLLMPRDRSKHAECSTRATSDRLRF